MEEKEKHENVGERRSSVFLFLIFRSIPTYAFRLRLYIFRQFSFQFSSHLTRASRRLSFYSVADDDYDCLIHLSVDSNCNKTDVGTGVPFSTRAPFACEALSEIIHLYVLCVYLNPVIDSLNPIRWLMGVDSGPAQMWRVKKDPKRESC